MDPGKEIEQDSQRQTKPPEAFAERFEIQEEIGRGGMSVVYRAREIILERTVAIKVLNSSFARDPSSLQRFRNEARSCSALQHPNIVQILSYGVNTEKEPFIVMELVDGVTLEQELKDSGPFEIQKLQDVFLPIIDALIYAHGKNLVHRDLKPGNIMILRDLGGSRQIRVKVLDFGIAKVLENEEMNDTQATVGLLGSPLYMSPEQCAGGKIDQRSDIYSLACVMYESIVGRPPFIGETPLETMYEHLKSSVPKLVEVSGSLNIPKAVFDVIIEALAKDPGKRIQTMSEFQEKMEKALTRTERMARKSQSRLARLHVVLYLAATAALVLVPLLFAFQIRNSQKIELSPKKNTEFGSLNDMLLLQQSRKFLEAGDLDGALQKGLDCLRVASKLAEEKPSWLCDAHTNLARIYDRKKDPENTEKQYLAAIAMFQPTALSRITTDGEYCRWLQAHNRNDQAESFYRKELQLCQQAIGGEADRDVGQQYLQFGAFLYQSGKFPEAATICKKCLWQFDHLTSKRCHQAAVDATFVYYDCCKNLGKTAEGLVEVRKTWSDLEQEIVIDPKAYLEYGMLAKEESFNSQAIAAYKLALKYAATSTSFNRKSVISEAETAIAEIEKNAAAKSR